MKSVDFGFRFTDAHDFVDMADGPALARKRKSRGSVIAVEPSGILKILGELYRRLISKCYRQHRRQDYRISRFIVELVDEIRGVKAINRNSGQIPHGPAGCVR